jgi:hypothetical protein
MMVLLVAGAGVIVAGLAAIGFGIPVKEFGFGNTLILTGTIGVCTGLIMMSLAIVVRELRALVPQLTAADLPAAPRPRRDAAVPAPSAAEADADAPPAEGALFSRDRPAAERAAATDAAPPWQQDALRERARAVPAEEPAAPAEPKRRNLLFQSSLRKDRERIVMDPAAAEGPAAAAPEAPPFSFEDAWPQVERSRPEASGRAPRMSSAARDQPAEPAPGTPQHSEAGPVTVLKSGVVDGMAYSLYSDGSIEADMPEGKMHFASIDELREHLDQRG